MPMEDASSLGRPAGRRRFRCCCSHRSRWVDEFEKAGCGLRDSRCGIASDVRRAVRLLNKVGDIRRNWLIGTEDGEYMYLSMCT